MKKIFACLFAFLLSFQSLSLCACASEKEFCVLLDAGHGGEDCGAIGVTGVYEKDLNLIFVGKLGALLRENGVSVEYTRQEDRLLYTEAQNVKGQRKKYDLRNRLDIFHNGDCDLMVSIHMNSFSEGKYRGFQVYYAEAFSEARHLAEIMHRSVTRELQPWNKRVAKASDGGIYLLTNAKKPAILIECGFLSNPEECEKLTEEDYQNRLCFLIFCAIIEYRENFLQGQLT